MQKIQTLFVKASVKFSVLNVDVHIQTGQSLLIFLRPACKTLNALGNGRMRRKKIPNVHAQQRLHNEQMRC